MFVDDIPAPGAYRVAIIRSASARGKLTSMRCPLLKAGYTLIKAEDVPGENRLFESDMPILASDAVSYIGEPVALLVGPDRIKLDEYAAQCIVEVEEEEACLSLSSAETVFCKKEMEWGNPPKQAAGEEGGEIVVEGNYETGIQEHWYSEAHGALAEITDHGPEESILIRTASQRPDHVRQAVSNVLNIDVEHIFVENVEIGIHFDGKIWHPSLIACLAALAAFKTRKPVKLQLKRQEDYLFSPKRAASAIRIESVLSPEGYVLETRLDMKIGLGAYAILGERMLETAAAAFSSVYKMGKLRAKISSMRYDVPPAGPFAGYGSAFASFALERHISKICDALDEDGEDWRGLRLLGKVKSRFKIDERTKAPVDSIAGAVSRKSGYKRKWAVYELLRRRGDKETERVLPQRGIGIAFALGETRDEAEAGPMAAIVVEVEIDRINCEAKIRGVWLVVSSGRLNDKAKAKQMLRRSLIAAIGWTSTEKIKYERGRTTPEISALYQILPVSETPPISIDFIEEPEKGAQNEDDLESLPFCVVPAAYTQAISQAVDHHFERIPITGQDIWRVMNIVSRQEESADKKAGEEGGA
ncbi:MAG: molybdopterin-dependent oxidoreductase [Spirochaetaceae bacterium]|jgi:CO/xanthine dehydrogenase Mo-binding subunit|nr:molybdopterin-dependent oxidoreductase [Spirochaetaceae bacterium]